MSKPLLTFLSLAFAAIALAACGGDDESDALVVYSGRNEELVGDLLEQYQQDTGAKIEVRYGDSSDLAATLLEEGGNTPADVFLSQDAGALGAVENEGLLAPLPRSILEQVEPRFRSEEGRWVGLTGRSRVIAYDKRELKPSELPQSVFDVPGEKWEGRVGWAPTNPSFQSFVTAMRELAGEERTRRWLEAMVADDTKVYPNNISIRDAIANGEIDIGLINHYYVAEAVAEEGEDYPVGVFFPPNDLGSLINVSGAAILEPSEKDAQARKFIDYMLSRQGQRYYADVTKEYPLAAGVRPDPALEPFDRIQAPEIDLADLDGLQETVKLLQETGAL
ncbi:MAG TPA: iron ABC transporter substrate-binding protein [Solirubrobacteraceae bacterium]|nr:iron ABC transporter substrate-binding protein [Solirubrobacteraceae bacterium]